MVKLRDRMELWEQGWELPPWWAWPLVVWTQWKRAKDR